MTDQANQEKTVFYGWINVTFLFMLYSIMMGFVFYGFTVIFPAMVESMGWGRGEASLAHTIRGLAVGFITPLAAISITRLGIKKTLIIGLSVGALSLLLLGTVTHELWQWTLIWGFAMPTAFALGGLLPIQTTVNYWFNVRRATAMGIVMTGGAAAGFVAAPLYTYIIKQTGTWQTGWLIASALCAVGVGIAFFVKDNPRELGQFPDGIDPDKAVDIDLTGKKQPKRVHQTKEIWTLKEALRTRAVILLVVCMIAQSWALYMVTVHGVLHLMDKDFSRMAAASVISTLILFSGIARFPVGVLADRIEPRILSAIALFGMALAMVGIWKAPQNMTLMLCIGGAYGLFFGATVITFPMLIANSFGPTAFAPLMGFVTPILICLAAPVPVLAGLIFDHYKSYNAAFIPIIVILIVATLSAWFFYPPQKKAAAVEPE